MYIQIETTDTQSNSTIAWNAALAEAVRKQAKGVFFPSGEYHFYAEGTVEKYRWFSNNDSGVKKIVMLTPDW
jgi:hypothetical protein